jgi:class 3 adenylate cyclase/tetratricopeptide (TPR) repeat protein
VSIVFCDVTGSTAMGEGLDPESLRDVMGRYFEAMRIAIERHGGTVEKFIGDAVMAVFGIPQLHEDDALRAVRAAADMQADLTILNKELERDRGVTIQVRIGVNTGEVVSNNAAAGQQLVTGDAVNVAARLEQHASPGQVLLGDATYRLVREAVDAQGVEPLELKGKSERAPAWHLIAVRDVAAATERHLDAPMVGRERQLQQLEHAFAAAIDDEQCQLFTVLGPAGVGKSRLVEEFVAGVGAAARVLRGRCLPYGDGITYFPVIEAVKDAAGLADFDLPDVVETKVCSVLAGDEHQELVCRRVSQLMGVTDSAGGEETFWAIRTFFEAAAREQPLVLVFDDIHWGEPTFLDLLEHIADWSRGSPILLLCMARSDLLDVRPTWGGGKLNATTVSLQPLSDEQSGALIEHMLGAMDLPAGVADRIVATAEGNPLFVEETLAMLIDDGSLARDGNGWMAARDLSGVTVPPSIQALLAARLDQLSVDERSVLESAAVVGKSFFAGAVRSLAPENARERVSRDLMAAVRKDLIRPDRSTLPGEDAFRFRHLLIRDASYDAIPKAQRAELHERFADWLEQVAGEAIAEQEEIVAYHLEQVIRYRAELGPPDERTRTTAERAARRLVDAARRAAGRGDHRAAATLLERAIVITPPGGPELATLYYDLGVALEFGRVSESLAAFERAAELASVNELRSLEWLAKIRYTYARMLVEPHSISTDDARAQLEHAVTVFEELGDDAALATAWRSLAELDWMPCRFDRASRSASRAVAHARRSGNQQLLARTILTSITADSFGSTRPEDGLLSIEERVGEAGPNFQLEAVGMIIRAICAAMLGRFDEGRALTQRASELLQGLGESFGLAALEEHLGDLERLAGRADASEQAYRRNVERLDDLGDEGHKSTGAANLARSLCALGRFDEAKPFADMALRIAAEDDLASQVTGRCAEALVLASRGHFEEAIALAREAVDLFAEAENPMTAGDAWMDLATVYQMAGQNPAAADAAREALGFFERKGVRPAIATTQAFLGDLG